MSRQPSGLGPELSQVVSGLDVDSCLYRDVLLRLVSNFFSLSLGVKEISLIVTDDSSEEAE